VTLNPVWLICVLSVLAAGLLWLVFRMTRPE